jgi:glutamate N-acetyltransferase/amino-acid N-acetyltransferase
MTYTMTGISKGAGMIRPNMATMLSFVATDAPSRDLVQKLLKLRLSIHLTVLPLMVILQPMTLVFLWQLVRLVVLKLHQKAMHATQSVDVLARIMNRLAQLIVRDGEGATKFITVVEGGANTQECCDVAYSVAESPLN